MNEPAFPSPNFPRNSTHEGMTLRDYFAAKALIAYYEDGSSADVKNAAEWCYEMADAMMAERSKP